MFIIQVLPSLENRGPDMSPGGAVDLRNTLELRTENNRPSEGPARAEVSCLPWKVISDTLSLSFSSPCLLTLTLTLTSARL